MKAWIITIGNEILIGKIINTNASWIANKLTMLGIDVKRIIVVPDDLDDIVNVYKDAISNADIIISTGGLGPTFDDITNFALAKALNRRLEINRDAYEEIKRKYEEKGLPLTEERIKMSKMPAGSVSLYNPVGTAPGIMIKIDNKLIFALPGVPSEMKAIFEQSIEKLLLKISGKKLVELSIYVYDIPESTLAPIISEAMKKFSPIYIKSHPKGIELGTPEIEIHITGMNGEEITKKIRNAANYIKRKVKELGGKIN